ncbi:AAA family ATPase [Labrenzia sp. CE80]|uniref:AAA family ATPase n=1 Tax=Labrenzia sp. CE80 TaxID=1788986 RepID=UPI00129BACB7|nr:AAA family ATPase [Labrenzia sp. CE80]
MSDTWWTNAEDLDDEQKAVVLLPNDGHNLIIGPPGCGKTNLLLLRASYLDRSGLKNFAVLTFARSLREFLASGASNYPFSPDKIQTYVRWGNTVLAENGQPTGQRDNFDEVRSSLLERLKVVAADNKPQNMFDCIFLDEAQDYTSEELKVLMSFTPRLFAVGDINQRIHSEDQDALNSLEKDGVSITRLTYHYRNGLKICRVADGIQGLVEKAEGLETTSNYDEEAYPSTVTRFSQMSLDEQIATCIEAIPSQLSAYPDEYIGVLCPKKEDLAVIAKQFKESHLFEQVHVQHGEYEAMTDERRIVLTTVHGAKGLEFRAEHFLAADHVKRFRLQKKMAYTAVTRCKTSLSVYHCGDLPGYFENGFAACEKPTRGPALDDLFGSNSE